MSPSLIAFLLIIGFYLLVLVYLELYLEPRCKHCSKPESCCDCWYY